MRWSDAFTTAIKIAAWLAITGLIGFALIGAGIVLLVTGNDSPVLSDDDSTRLLVGTIILGIGGVWALIAATAVFVKYVSQAVYDLADPVLSDVYARVIYIQQMMPQASQTWRTPKPQPEPDAEPQDEPRRAPSPYEPGA